MQTSLQEASGPRSPTPHPHSGRFPHLVLHVLQPLKPQVGDDARRPVVNRENVDLELLRSSRDDLEARFREVGEGGFGRQSRFISGDYLHLSVAPPP